MTGLLQLRLMPRSYLPATPVQSRPPGIIGQPKVFADCTTLQPDQSLKKRVLDCCTLCNISKKSFMNYINIAAFLVHSGEVSSHLPLPETSSILNNCQLLLHITLFPSAEDVAPSLISRGQLATRINNRTMEQLPLK